MSTVSVFTIPVAFLITLATVPLVQHFCLHMQILDKPGPLKIHAHPIPRLGGVAIFLAVFAGVFAANHHPNGSEWHFLSAAGLVWIVGLLDDLRGLHPVPRLLAQITGAAILWIGGWHSHLFAYSVADLAGVCVFAVLFVNSWNFLDGSDGLAAGFSCIVALAYAVLPHQSLSADGFAVACAVAAACAAFLLFNANPASVFLGDSGSTLLGFSVAFLGLDYAKAGAGTVHLQLFPFVVASMPLLDAIRIVIQRASQRRSLFEGSRCHYYDVLLASGDAPRKVAFVSWVVGLICAAIGLLSVYFRLSQVWPFIAIVLVAAWIASVVSAPKRRPHALSAKRNVSLSN
jgi:UDP-GlcNAc:undecaprenyl-phosphate/decaprenyl-phosphate GlcNAc-1-phosphate transferase